ncbi:PEP/pyruvate-binding domain-containing protein [Actinobaculum sp. 313]|uniref:PEP/pyruvate-binding domain-containing protein n=1 Tax=Actinobaculum sp. 313 TaxID=2495645 RepID=UPI000D525CD9|nr:PEP/pyruvate-binding domain-containing protein [Actinobaculum sp. 313]AWE42251.1 pyruvate, water dikinase [Actinobaculum sp. 313]
MIAWFDEADAGNAQRVGGKALHLAECARAGFPVPRGFCITTRAYRETLGSSTAQIREDAAKGRASLARNRILESVIPPTVQTAICTAYRLLGSPPVAVRSSATAEDLAEASFAGQQETFLGVIGESAVLYAVRRCWTSLWSDRAVAYRKTQGIPDDALALAVVVQTMVPADTAGVLFTRNPVTGSEDTMLVNSSYGLGESVVTGLVTPDTFTLARRPPGVLTREIGRKETRIDASPGSPPTTRTVPEQDRGRQSITDKQLMRLLGLGEQVEAYYGCGQDIEWAFCGEELYLLQTRPITTVTDAVVSRNERAAARLSKVLRDDMIEHYPAPFPLDLFAVHQIQDAIQELMRAAGLKVDSAAALIRGEGTGVIRIRMTAPRPTLTTPARLAVLFHRGMSHDPARWTHEESRLRSRLDAMLQRVTRLREMSDREVMDLVHLSLAECSRLTASRFLNYNAPLVVNRTICSLLIRLVHANPQVTPEELLIGVPYKTAAMTAQISLLAQQAREFGLTALLTGTPSDRLPAVLSGSKRGRQFQELVDEFLASYGARCTRLYLPFSNRSWREDPGSFYTLLATTLRGNPVQIPQNTPVLSTLPRTRGENTTRFINARLPRPLRFLWKRNAQRFQARHIAREGTAYMLEEFFCVARAGMDEISRRLVDRGQLDNPANIRFLYMEEVQQALDDADKQLSSLAARRQRVRPTAQSVWLDRGDPEVGSTLDELHTLRGQPSSSGRACGPARIIHSPDEAARLQPGDILVCPYTDPTWTPLFAVAAAVVADSGGPLSHAAIVAREYGIPAVLGTGNATSLPDGVELLVDGTAGTVTITDPAAPSSHSPS